MSEPDNLSNAPGQSALERIQKDRRALVAIDLGAESCRVSLLRWQSGTPQITMLHRIPNAPITTHDEAGEHLHWPLDRILAGIEEGLRKAAEAAPEGIRSIAVDGWAVDYVRLGPDGKPLRPPFCYRDERTLASKDAIESVLSPHQIFAESGAFPLRINTVYQLFADQQLRLLRDQLFGLRVEFGDARLPQVIAVRVVARLLDLPLAALGAQLVER